MPLTLKGDFTLHIDFTALKEQKEELIKQTWQDDSSNKLLEGIISLLDDIQDQAVEKYGLPEAEVFHTTEK